MIHLIREEATAEQMSEMLEQLENYVKLAVDVRRGILAGGGALHAIVGTFMIMILLGLGYFTIILSRETWFAWRITGPSAIGSLNGMPSSTTLAPARSIVGSIAAVASSDG